MKRILIISIVALVVLVGGHILYLFSMSPGEEYPNDSYLASEPNKVALVMTAHDDDAIGCAGTITQLTKNGWRVNVITFYGKWHGEINPKRKEELWKACAIQGVQNVEMFDFVIQRTDTVKEPWMPVPYDQFDRYLKTDSLKIFALQAIQRFRPSVVFSLDNVMGGYGHPEHVAASQVVVTAVKELRGTSNFSVRRIYQAVYTPSQAESITGNLPAFQAGKRVYHCNGMPEPTVQIDIRSEASEKKNVMMAYVTQVGPIRKIWPYYNWYPSWLYFGIFSKEYFRVLDAEKI